MRQLILAISRALPVIANMSLITLVIIVAFALLGMHGLYRHYGPRDDGELPRLGVVHSCSYFSLTILLL